MTKTIQNTLTIVAAGVLFLAIAVWTGMQVNRAWGSVSETDEYLATSTATSNVYGAWTGDTLIDTGTGVLGSVVITGANTGIVNIYDATTTNIAQRAASKATSTILIASFPASTAAGTYTFDVQLKDGFLVDLVSGNMPTSTITYRVN